MGLLGDIFDLVFDSDTDTTPTPHLFDVHCPKCGSDHGIMSVEYDNQEYTFYCKSCGLAFNTKRVGNTKNIADQIRQLIVLKNIDEATNLLSYYNQISRNDKYHSQKEYVCNYLIGDALISQRSDYDGAKKFIQKALSFEEYNYYRWKCLYDMYLIHIHNDEIQTARKYILLAYQIVEGEEVIDVEGEKVNAEEFMQNEFNTIDDEYTKHFLELPYRERQTLLIANSFVDLSQDHFVTLHIDSDLSALSFPIGHPKVNEMYVAHPLTTNRYMPIESYQLELIEDRVREFCELAQGLGATEINIECLNSNSNDSASSENRNLSGGISRGATSLHGAGHDEYSRRLIEEISRSVSLHQTFQPHKAPTLPSNMIWYEGEPTWQRLYRQRMEGILTHEERIETKKSQVVDNREMKEIKAELETLFADMGIAFDKTEESKFEQQENAVLAISVKFAPLSQLTGSVSSMPQGSMFTENEQKYIDEVKECLADGEITRTGRRLLNMHRERLGISESRASELEASVATPQLTDDEKEYLEAYREACEDGQLSDKDRRMLNRFRDTLGITEERAKEIEKYKLIK